MVKQRVREIRYHRALMRDALLIMRSGVGDIQQARTDYYLAREWLEQNDKQKVTDHEQSS